MGRGGVPLCYLPHGGANIWRMHERVHLKSPAGQRHVILEMYRMYLFTADLTLIINNFKSFGGPSNVRATATTGHN